MNKTIPITLADLNLSFDARTRTYHQETTWTRPKNQPSETSSPPQA